MQMSSTVKAPRSYQPLDDDDDVSSTDLLSLKVLHVCHTAYSRNYIRDFITGVTDGHRVPWPRIFEAIWLLTFAKSVGKHVQIDKALTESCPDTSMATDRVAGRIRS
jgi:hypothetical protein